MGMAQRPGDIEQTKRLPISRKQSKALREHIDPRLHSEVAAHAAFPSRAQRSTPCRIAN
jgi:hypothetical protein